MRASYRRGVVLAAMVVLSSCGGAPGPKPSGTTPTASPHATATPATPPHATATPATPPSATATPATTTAAANPTATATSVATAPAASKLPLPKGTTVLHVGDSFADALGKDLKKELQKRDIKNVLKYQEATYIPEWAGFKMGFAQLLAAHDPDFVIITLGGNELAMPDPTKRADPVRRLVKQIGERPCIWIAAPLWEKAPNTGLLEVIKNNCAPCLFVDTNELIDNLERLDDKIHPTIPERRRWARYMIRWLESNLAGDTKQPWRLRQKLVAPPNDEPPSSHKYRKR
jgi:lysophospholipase L1-like esterase